MLEEIYHSEYFFHAMYHEFEKIIIHFEANGMIHTKSAIELYVEPDLIKFEFSLN